MSPPLGEGRATLLLAAAVHRAAGHGSGTAPVTGGDISVGHVLLQMIVALVVVVGGVWGVGKVMGRARRSGAGAKRGARSSTPLTVLSRQSLGKGLSIAAVQWGEREVLVGIAGSTITFLDETRTDADPEARPVAPLAGMAAVRSVAGRPGATAPGTAAPTATAASATGHTASTMSLVPPQLAAEGAGPAGRPSFLDSLRAATVRR
ncbi:MAG TPA: flagellar biosynthetic protein FliO [Acidimicrobiales bacterium]